MILKERLLQCRLVRYLALARPSRGALSQLGWFDVDKQELKISGPNAIPWFVYGAIDFIDQTLSPTLSVLELGGGSSTLFWLSRGNKVTTVESDESWIEAIYEHTSSLVNHELLHLNPISPESLSRHLEKKFDVIVNDFNGGGDRGSLVEWIRDSLEEGGWIIWDNSDREQYSEALAQLHQEGFGELKFFGLGPINAYATQTSILSRRIPQRDWETIPKRSIKY